MEAYRDQYATLFNGGKDVILLAVSTDSPEDQQSWAKDARFPWRFGSDADGHVGSLFGAYSAERKMDDRTLVVVGPDGRIAYEARPFRQMAQDAYDELAQVIDKVAGGK